MGEGQSSSKDTESIRCRYCEFEIPDGDEDKLWEHLKEHHPFSRDAMPAACPYCGLQIDDRDWHKFLQHVKESHPNSWRNRDNWMFAVLEGDRYTIETGLYGRKKELLAKTRLGEEKVEIPAAAVEALLARGVFRNYPSFLYGKYWERGLITSSLSMINIYEEIEACLYHTDPVLIRGETGTGKEIVAKVIHDLSGLERDRFFPVNCTGWSQELIDSELFGHVKGAFTGAIEDKEGVFEAAQGGTLFLDEIGDMPPLVQAKVLRVLNDGSYNKVGSPKPEKLEKPPRVIAATAKRITPRWPTDLEEDEAERFRSDLFYRISTMKIDLPPLREHLEDIPLLTYYFIKLNNKESREKIKAISLSYLYQMLLYPWPGNVRELEQFVNATCNEVRSYTYSVIGMPLIIATGLARSDLLLYTIDKEIERMLEEEGDVKVDDLPAFDVYRLLTAADPFLEEDQRHWWHPEHRSGVEYRWWEPPFIKKRHEEYVRRRRRERGDDQAWSSEGGDSETRTTSYLDLSWKEAIAKFEHDYAEMMLDKHDGNKKAAYEEMGVGATKFKRMLNARPVDQNDERSSK